MGLDVSHDCWSGSYSAFTRWRHTLAKAAGYWILPVTYPDGGTVESIMIEWHRYQDGQLYGEWTEKPHDPLIVLFAHSDCEGVIKPEEAVPLADALEKLLPKIEALNSKDAGHIVAQGGTIEVTKKFISGLREAAAAGEPVEFH